LSNIDRDIQNLTLYRQTATIDQLRETVRNWLLGAREAAGGNQTFYLLTEGFPENRFIRLDKPEQLEDFLTAPGDTTAFHLFCRTHYLRGRRRLDNGENGRFRLLATYAECNSETPWEKETIPYAGEPVASSYSLWGRWDDDVECFFENQIPRKLDYPIEGKPAQGTRAALQGREYLDAGGRLVFFAFCGPGIQPEYT